MTQGTPGNAASGESLTRKTIREAEERAAARRAEEEARKEPGRVREMEALLREANRKLADPGAYGLTAQQRAAIYQARRSLQVKLMPAAAAGVGDLTIRDLFNPKVT